MLLATTRSMRFNHAQCTQLMLTRQNNYVIIGICNCLIAACTHQTVMRSFLRRSLAGAPPLLIGGGAHVAVLTLTYDIDQQ